MAFQNSVLIDNEQGIFSAIGLLTLKLEGPFEYWSREDIDDEMAKGAIFYAFDNDIVKDGRLDVASICIADVTDDLSEPDVSILEQADISALDAFLEKNVKSQLAEDGRELTQWMSSQLNQSNGENGLFTAYITRDNGKERQIFTLRIKINGRKVVVMGDFDIAKKDTLVGPIYSIMCNIRTHD